MYYTLMLIVALVQSNQDMHTQTHTIYLDYYYALMLIVALIKSDQVMYTQTHTINLDYVL